MHKEYKGYLSLEGSFVFPIVLVIFYLVIIGAISLFMRCIDASTDYIKELHSARGMNNEEIIYENMYGYYGDTAAGVHYINPLMKLEERDEY